MQELAHDGQRDDMLQALCRIADQLKRIADQLKRIADQQEGKQ